MSKIEWTGKTWNPLAGCDPISPACKNCYAARMTRRLEAMGQVDYAGLTNDKHFNGVVRTLPHKLDVPLRRKKPTMWFVNSMSDLFHEDVPFEFVDHVFAVMALCRQHTFQVLTKRPERMAEYFTSKAKRKDARFATDFLPFHQLIGPTMSTHDDVEKWCEQNRVTRKERERRLEQLFYVNEEFSPPAWPLPNVWLGTTVENQEQADKRIPHLLQTPAAVRFLSCEPLLGKINLPFTSLAKSGVLQSGEEIREIHWVICGGESGAGARPMHPDWARSLRDQCVAAGVPFFFKQWGEWAPYHTHDYYPESKPLTCMKVNGETSWVAGDVSDGVLSNYSTNYEESDKAIERVGKKASGRLLDGREWNEMPEVANAN